MAEMPKKRRQHVKFEKKSAGSDGQPAKERRRRPDIKVTSRTESASFSRGLVLSVLLLVALIAAGVHVMGQRPDAHFVRATEMLDDYERGRGEEALNYHNQVYDRALNELDQVNPESVSYAEAIALRQDIDAKREAFYVKVREAEQRKKARKTSREEKRAELATKQAYSRMHPQLEYPECD